MALQKYVFFCWTDGLNSVIRTMANVMVFS